jgi:hypothetical protein
MTGINELKFSVPASLYISKNKRVMGFQGQNPEGEGQWWVERQLPHPSRWLGGVF